MTGMGLNTLSRYARQHPDRIPHVGEGRKRRYPAEAIPVFEELKREALARRGRPRSRPTALPSETRHLLQVMGRLLKELTQVVDKLSKE
jgi:hypothetical protein